MYVSSRIDCLLASVEGFAAGLAVNSTLKELGLQENTGGITEIGWCAVFGALQAQCRLVKLKLGHNDLTFDTAARVLSSAIAHTGTLNSLDLTYCNAFAEGWRDAMHSSSCRLEVLSLKACGLNRAVLSSLVSVLARHSTLKYLDPLPATDSPRPVGRSCSRACEIRTQHWKLLNLSDNEIDDAAVEVLTSALENSIRLKELDLSNNNNISAAGWRAFSATLQKPHSALEILDLSDNELGSETLRSFAEALVNNNKLKKLFIEPSWNNDDGWTAFSHVLCDSTSIMSTYNSNHTLGKIGNYSWLHNDVQSLLKINRDNTVTAAARLKIIRTHFSGDHVSMQPFTDMELTVLPQALDWMGTDDDVLDLNIYVSA